MRICGDPSPLPEEWEVATHCRGCSLGHCPLQQKISLLMVEQGTIGLCLAMFLPKAKPRPYLKGERNLCSANGKIYSCVGGHRYKPPCWLLGTELLLFSTVWHRGSR